MGAPALRALAGPTQTMPPVEDERTSRATRRFHDERLTARLRRSLQVLEVTHDVAFLHSRPRRKLVRRQRTLEEGLTERLANGLGPLGYGTAHRASLPDSGSASAQRFAAVMEREVSRPDRPFVE